MLEARDLECERGGRKLFGGLSLSAGPGELLRVAGPNGSGKTSLLRILCGLLTPSRGEVRWKGQRIAELNEELRPEKERLEGEGYAVQSAVHFGDAAKEIVEFAASERVDLIAMTTHGHRLIGDLLFGSTIEVVRHKSAVPLLVVRAST